MKVILMKGKRRLNRESRRRKKKFHRKIILIFILLIILMVVIRNTYSRYSSYGTSAADVDVAFYFVKGETLSEDIVLDEIAPGNSYTYTFSVANNNGIQRTETALKYTITIKATTNLPLTYKLYVNDGNENIIEEYEITKDEDETYFKTMKSAEKTFGFKENEEDTYKLEITFPEEYNSMEYQGTIEYLEMKIDAQQIVQ
jgi:hypothetical protein